MNMRAILGGIAAALLLASGPVAAQSAPGGGQVPANETKIVGDWMVRCFPVKSITPCDMIYVRVVKRTGRPILQMRLAYAPAQDKHLFTIGVPLGVAFAKGLVLSTDAGSTQPMPFQRCDQNGCYVESVMGNGSIDAIARAGTNPKLNFAFFHGEAVSTPFPLNGFAEARDTLVQLSKGRATSAPPPAADGQ